MAESLNDLRQSSRKVIDIALDYQFGSAEAYSRSFKAEFGFSPKEYREQNIVVVPYRKPALDEDALRYRGAELRLEPEFKEIEPFCVVGYRTSFVAPLARRLEYLEDVSAVWQRLIADEAKIPNRIDGIKIGLGDGVSLAHHHIHDDRMEYVAAVPVSKAADIPEGMEAAEVPGGLYAVFQATGYHRQTQLTVDYVYATWLPRSGRRRREGPSFTWVDHRVEPLSATTSKVLFYLPLEEN